MLKLMREEKQFLVEQVQSYFEMERSEEIGSLAAEQMLDHMIELLGPYLYNQAMSDARKAVMDRMQTLEDELYALEKPAFAKRR